MWVTHVCFLVIVIVVVVVSGGGGVGFAGFGFVREVGGGVGCTTGGGSGGVAPVHEPCVTYALWVIYSFILVVIVVVAACGGGVRWTTGGFGGGSGGVTAVHEPCVTHHPLGVTHIRFILVVIVVVVVAACGGGVGLKGFDFGILAIQAIAALGIWDEIWVLLLNIAFVGHGFFYSCFFCIIVGGGGGGGSGGGSGGFVKEIALSGMGMERGGQESKEEEEGEMFG